MKAFNYEIGAYGEKIAKDYLRQNGYYIIEENFRCRTGEIDIIARDSSFICFVEVKSRFNLDYGAPRESITLSKQRKILKTAKYYILIKNLRNYNFRFDVIEVYLKDESYEVNLIKNAF